MKDRLEKFIKSEGLTPSRFAEIMGVQPSSISHILGGRNKPSFDFIEKMLLRFPKINPDWLLLGKGQIYREQERLLSAASSSSSTPVSTPASSLFEFPENTPSTTSSEIYPSESPLASSSTNASSSSSASNSTGTTPSSTGTETRPTSFSAQKNAQPAISPNKTLLAAFGEGNIDCIVIFRKDRTFTYYYPDTF